METNSKLNTNIPEEEVRELASKIIKLQTSGEGFSIEEKEGSYRFFKNKEEYILSTEEISAIELFLNTINVTEDVFTK